MRVLKYGRAQAVETSLNIVAVSVTVTTASNKEKNLDITMTSK